MADPFEILGLEARFHVKAAEVERAYLRAVAACHPDLAGADQAAEAEASRCTAALNRARAVLLDPEARARALLRRLGVSDSGDERDLPEGFLADILETRMAFEDAVAAGDERELARLRAWASDERERYIRKVDDLFRQIESGPGAAHASAIRRELNAWRYIERMLDQAADG